MKIAGLDIGTTSVSGVIIDTETGGQIVSRSKFRTWAAWV